MVTKKCVIQTVMWLKWAWLIPIHCKKLKAIVLLFLNYLRTRPMVIIYNLICLSKFNTTRQASNFYGPLFYEASI
jgi:hypothetical protein